MKIAVRSIALVVAFAFTLSGPLATFAIAQQPAPQPAESTTAYDVGAGFANVFFVPGKVVLCGLGIVAGGLLLGLTFGNAYKAAAAAGREGCGGKWVLSGEDLRPTEEIIDQERLVKY